MSPMWLSCISLAVPLRFHDAHTHEGDWTRNKLELQLGHKTSQPCVVEDMRVSDMGMFEKVMCFINCVLLF